ncbi:hypothetical protein BDQ17DRAFT_1329302 [Cyathus striatus]|nr:hypothetical protein BDQ17DRAFT_1329302 [Cyathus striatus]
MPVLPEDNRVFREVTRIHNTIGLEKHLDNAGVEEATVGVVEVELGRRGRRRDTGRTGGLSHGNGRLQSVDGAVGIVESGGDALPGVNGTIETLATSRGRPTKT